MTNVSTVWGLDELKALKLGAEDLQFSTEETMQLDATLEISTDPLDIIQHTYCTNCDADLDIEWTPFDLSYGNIKARMFLKQDNHVRLLKNVQCPCCKMYSRNFLYVTVNV